MFSKYKKGGGPAGAGNPKLKSVDGGAAAPEAQQGAANVPATQAKPQVMRKPSGAGVTPVLTRAAEQFVTPLSASALAGASGRETKS